jgi:hypothetical protein
MIKLIYGALIMMVIIGGLMHAALSQMDQQRSVMCSGQTYNNITCKKMSPLFYARGCGTTDSNVIPVTAGDRIVVWTDTNKSGTVTGVTDQIGDPYAPLGSLTDARWGPSNALTDAAWTAIARKTATLNITVNCNGSGGTYELAAIALSSSVGTVGVDCSSIWTAVMHATSVSSTCAAVKDNDVVLSMVDWYNTQPRAGSGWSELKDKGTEWVFELKKDSSAGAVTGTWTNFTDDMISGTVAFNDGKR